MGSQSQTDSGFLALSLACVTSGKFLDFSRPQASYLVGAG